MEVKKKIIARRNKRRQTYIRLLVTSIIMMIILLIGGVIYGYVNEKIVNEHIAKTLKATDEQQLINKKSFTLYDLEHNGIVQQKEITEMPIVRYQHIINHYYSLLYHDTANTLQSHTFVITENQLYDTLSYYIDNHLIKQVYQPIAWSLILPMKDEILAQVLSQHKYTDNQLVAFKTVDSQRLEYQLLNLGYQLSYSNNLYMTEPEAIFQSAPTGELNDEGVFGYRIPAFLTTDKGTLLAVADEHRNDNADEGDINAVLRRSVDGGGTWLEQQQILDLYDRPGNSKENKMSAFNIDSAMVQDPQTKRIFMMYDMFPEMNGILDVKTNDWPYKEVAGEQRLIVLNGQREYTVDSQGIVYDDNNIQTDYRVVVNPTAEGYRDKGDLYQQDILVGNIYMKNSPLEVIKTSYVWYQYSDDDGLTWSMPIDITASVYQRWTPIYGIGPGTGIVLQNGRLIFASYSTNTIGELKSSQSTHTIYSDDHGHTWQSSEAINDQRLYNGNQLSAATLNDREAQNSEGQLIQLNNGQLQMFMRNMTKYVQVGESNDGGTTWVDEVRDTNIHDPGVQMSVLHLNYGGQEYVLVSNPDGPEERVNGSVGIAKVLEDNTLEWMKSMRIQDGTYAYSSIVQQHNDEYGNAMFGILYEHSEPGDNLFSIYYRRFNLDYLLNNDITQSQQLLSVVDIRLEDKGYKIRLSNGASIYTTK